MKSATDPIDINVGRSPEESFWRMVVFCAIGLCIAILYPLSRINYLLFHNLVELSSVAVSITLFSIGWNSRHIIRNDAFTLLSIAFLVIAGIDLLHAISYKGMGVFPTVGVDPPTQLWIAARFLEAMSYLLAGWLFGKTDWIKPWRTLSLYLVVGALLILSIWPWQIFPVCLTEASGLSTFKVAAEWLICTLLAISGLFFWRSQKKFDPLVLKLLLLSIGLTIMSEIAFTLYQDVYGISNVLGHFLKLSSVVMVYRALVLGSLKTPYRTLFRELTESHLTLDSELAQRRATAEQLRLANQELEAFVRTVSHDLRLPLTVISSGAELLQSELKDQIGPAQKELLGNIGIQGHRMSTLLNDLLCMAQVGTLDQKPQLIDPSQTARQAIADLSEEIMANGCRVTVEEMPALLAHPSLIYQLLANLIANAVRYGCGPEKQVVVGAEKRGSLYRMFVRDHGPGIPREEREHVFTVFYRVKGNQPQGTGIGLAIVQKIACYYSGRVFVEETSGGGATFWVELEDDHGSVENGT